MEKEPLTSRLEITAIIVGLVLNIFIAGVGWGTLWTKVGNIEKRMERFESHLNSQTSKSPYNPYPISSSRGNWWFTLPASPASAWEIQADSNRITPPRDTSKLR